MSMRWRVRLEVRCVVEVEVEAADEEEARLVAEQGHPYEIRLRDARHAIMSDERRVIDVRPID